MDKDASVVLLHRRGMVHMESKLKLIRLNQQLSEFMVNQELEPLCSKYLELEHTVRVNRQLLEITANRREASRVTVTCNKESKGILSRLLDQLGIASRESLVTCILRSQLVLEPMANNQG